MTLPETQLEALGLDDRGPSVVAIGGGSGLAQSLHALQCFAGDITAIVSVADDGGSSGRLAPALEIPPPGDLRKAMLALAGGPSLWGELMAHRFDRGDVAGHSLGNLMLAGLTEIIGDFTTALRTAERLLSCNGRVVPVATEALHLEALVDGLPVKGQVAIGQGMGTVSELKVQAGAKANPEALTAIHEADVVVLCAGSLYTSVVCNLIVPGVAEAITESDASIVAILNLVTEHGETLGLDGYGHINALHVVGGLERAGTIVSHRGSLVVPHDLERVEISEDEAHDLGWDLVEWEIADHHAERPMHDALRLGRVMAGLWR